MAPCWLIVLLCSPLWHSEGVEGWGGLSTVPSESECRPYIEKALKEHSPETPQEAVDTMGTEQTMSPDQSANQEGSIEETEEATTTESTEGETGEAQAEGEGESMETKETTESESIEEVLNDNTTGESEEGQPTDQAIESTETQKSTPDESTEEEQKTEESTETEEVNKELSADQQSLEDGNESAAENIETSTEGTEEMSKEREESVEIPGDNTIEDKSAEKETSGEEQIAKESLESTEQGAEVSEETEEETQETKPEENSEEAKPSEESPEENPEESTEKVETSGDALTSTEDQVAGESIEIPGGEVTDSAETTESLETTESTEGTESIETETNKESVEETTESMEPSIEDTTESTEPSVEESTEPSVEDTTESTEPEELKESVEETTEPSEHTVQDTTESLVDDTSEVSTEEKTEDVEGGTTEASGEEPQESQEAPEGTLSESTEETAAQPEIANETLEEKPSTGEGKEKGEEDQAETPEEPAEQEPAVEEDTVSEPNNVEDQLTLEFEAPKVRRPRDHIAEILHLVPESPETELLLAKSIDSTLKELKRLYDTAIQPLEILFKYRDLSNRHFGDPEIFSKPLILFMGPWSGGKSTILNYLLDNEFRTSSLRTGAEPSPAYFNILMWGEREEVLDGTQLAADWTFSGLQKFGQGLLDRLKGLRLNSPLLEKVNIVEIPGILEIRKQVERLFPFNDACQWFIDRADIIFLVYDPSKLDVGPETEAILDQLKGREYQTRIILNKADQVKPEELMRVQGTLIWNISPLMSSQEPPVMYSTSLWSIPYEQGAPTRLLHAQERAFLRDLRQAIDKRVENKIASARRFAVRVRNHAKMVDCYLTTYYNHKTFFGNRKKVADDIIEHPQNYHIYEGLSTLTNISRYDLPDPEVYRDFFRLNPVYDFQRLSDTCTYFRGCPINRLDVAIAYDLPELVGKYKKQAEKVLDAAAKQTTKS